MEETILADETGEQPNFGGSPSVTDGTASQAAPPKLFVPSPMLID